MSQELLLTYVLPRFAVNEILNPRLAPSGGLEAGWALFRVHILRSQGTFTK
jgi:hypothetical protein